MARKERYLVGLDVGTSKVTAVVAEMVEREGLDIVGLGVAESRGIRRGVVVNLEAAVDSIKKAIEEAELMAGVEIDSVHLALSGPHIKGFNSRGVIAVAGKNREVSREDVRRAIDAAKAVSLPTGREIVHVLLGRRHNQVFLGREVVEDGDLGDLRGGGDLRDRDLVEAAFHEHVDRDAPEPGLGLCLLPFPKASGGCCHACHYTEKIFYLRKIID